MNEGRLEWELSSALDRVEEQARNEPVDLEVLKDVAKRLMALLAREVRRAA